MFDIEKTRRSAKEATDPTVRKAQLLEACDEIERLRAGLNIIAAGEAFDPQRHAQDTLLNGSTAKLGEAFVDGMSVKRKGEQ